MRITFIGGGNMASALLGGLLQGVVSADEVRVIDPSAAQRETLQRQLGVHVFEQAGADALDSDVWVLAVKPQQMRDVAAQIAPHARNPLVISVAAGIRAADLSRWLGGHTRIVRCMPNTPALIGLGVTGLAASEAVGQEDRDTAQRILAAVGQTVWVAHEGLLDAVTAVSGSGPAYVFLFLEAMQRAALELGLDAEQARTLALGTFTGAAQLALRSDEPPAVLRERVTSKGGTTYAALQHMTAQGLPQIIVDAVGAACRRSVELGDEFGRDPA